MEAVGLPMAAECPLCTAGSGKPPGHSGPHRRKAAVAAAAAAATPACEKPPLSPPADDAPASPLPVVFGVAERIIALDRDGLECDGTVERVEALPSATKYLVKFTDPNSSHIRWLEWVTQARCFKPAQRSLFQESEVSPVGPKDTSLDAAPACARAAAAPSAAVAGRLLTSRFRGVHLHKSSGRYQTEIGHGGKNLYIGTYDTEQMAARAYDVYARELKGAGAILNFPASSSRYNGVSHHISKGPRGTASWKASITFKKKTWQLGLFEDEEDAALAYDAAARGLQGVLAESSKRSKLNFPRANEVVRVNCDLTGDGRVAAVWGYRRASSDTGGSAMAMSAGATRRLARRGGTSSAIGARLDARTEWTDGVPSWHAHFFSSSSSSSSSPAVSAGGAAAATEDKRSHRTLVKLGSFSSEKAAARASRVAAEREQTNAARAAAQERRLLSVVASAVEWLVYTVETNSRKEALEVEKTVMHMIETVELKAAEEDAAEAVERERVARAEERKRKEEEAAAAAARVRVARAEEMQRRNDARAVQAAVYDMVKGVVLREQKEAREMRQHLARQRSVGAVLKRLVRSVEAAALEETKRAARIKRDVGAALQALIGRVEAVAAAEMRVSERERARREEEERRREQERERQEHRRRQTQLGLPSILAMPSQQQQPPRSQLQHPRRRRQAQQVPEDLQPPPRRRRQQANPPPAAAAAAAAAVEPEPDNEAGCAICMTRFALIPQGTPIVRLRCRSVESQNARMFCFLRVFILRSKRWIAKTRQDKTIQDKTRHARDMRSNAQT